MSPKCLENQPHGYRLSPFILIIKLIQNGTWNIGVHRSLHINDINGNEYQTNLQDRETVTWTFSFLNIFISGPYNWIMESFWIIYLSFMKYLKWAHCPLVNVRTFWKGAAARISNLKVTTTHPIPASLYFSAMLPKFFNSSARFNCSNFSM